MNLYEALDRLRSTITNLPYLPLALSPPDWRAPWSELRKTNYETPHYFHSAVLSALFPCTRLSGVCLICPTRCPTTHES